MRTLLVLVSCLSGSVAVAQDLQSMQRAQALGTVLAAEEKCGLSYDQDAIKAWIDGNVPADDMDFASTLSLMTMGMQSQLDEMSKSSLTAHCRSVERTARKYHFVK